MCQVIAQISWGIVVPGRAAAQIEMVNKYEAMKLPGMVNGTYSQTLFILLARV